ncbi:hypothetical protein KY362_03520 [Candidatus Woesearchaeota archaeon]|nr:hypothetical protein [Candidatus Woesearchaeota archaeon]
MSKALAKIDPKKLKAVMEIPAVKALLEKQKAGKDVLKDYELARQAIDTFYRQGEFASHKITHKDIDRISTRLLGTKKFKKVGWFMKKVGWIIPIIMPYNYRWEANRLMEDPEIRDSDLDVEDVIDSVRMSKARYNTALVLAKWSDVVDRASSIIGLLLEAGTAVETFGIGSVIANIPEEAVELLLKIPFLSYVYKKFPEHRGKVYQLAGVEAATFIPALGDIYDMLTNMYVHTVHDFIRDDAKARLLEWKKNGRPEGDVIDAEFTEGKKTQKHLAQRPVAELKPKKESMTPPGLPASRAGRTADADIEAQLEEMKREVAESEKRPAPQR